MKKTLILCVTGMLMLWSCNKQKDLEEPSSQSATYTTSNADALPIAEDGEPMVLGVQYNNPYKLKYMQAAYESLSAAGIVSEKPFTVRVTHRYIKYTPTNEEEFDNLLADTNLFFYDYPLDYEIVVQGNFYHDPSVPEGQPTPQYVVVPNGYTYNTTIAHTVLAELYLPEEDQQLLGENLIENLTYANMLIEDAFGKSGDYFEPATPWEPGGGGAGSGPPKVDGTITVFDNRLNQTIGLQGVQVTANRWFTTRKAYTRADGTYTLDGDPFRRPADYTIHFKSKPQFKIMNSNDLNNAKIVRNNISGNSWSHNIPNGLDRMHATMFRAAYRYYFGNTGGLRKPYRPRIQKLVSKQNRDGAGINYIVFPTLKIARYEGANKTNEYDCDEIFSTTIHELAHTAHVKTMNNFADFAGVSSFISESWAVAVEWQVTQMEYRERGIANYGSETYFVPGLLYPNNYAFQYWHITWVPNPFSPLLPPIATDDEYTSIFINLVDNFNEQGGWFQGEGIGSVNDQVSGYNLATIQQNYLKHIYSASSLKSQLKANKPAGVTDAQIDLLLSFY